MRNVKLHDRSMCATAASAVVRRRLTARRSGAILLEVVVSLGLLVAAMAVIGFQINTSLSMANATDIRTRALLLVDTKMAELDAGVLNPSWSGDDLRGHFGIIYPGYSWRMRVKPAEIPNLYLVWLDIGFNAAQVNQQVVNPDLDIHIDDPDTQILRTVYRLVPKPADVNVQRDFGLSQEELDAMVAAASAAGDANVGMASDAAGALSGGGTSGGGTAGGGTGGGSSAGGSTTNPDDVMGMLTKLIQAVVSGGLDPNNINPRDLAQYLDDETLEALGPLIDMYFGNGPGAGQLPGPLDNPLIRSMLGGNRRNNRNPRQGQGTGAGQDQGDNGTRGNNRDNDRNDGSNRNDEPNQNTGPNNNNNAGQDNNPGPRRPGGPRSNNNAGGSNNRNDNPRRPNRPSENRTPSR